MVLQRDQEDSGLIVGEGRLRGSVVCGGGRLHRAGLRQRRVAVVAELRANGVGLEILVDDYGWAVLAALWRVPAALWTGIVAAKNWIVSSGRGIVDVGVA